MSYCSSAKYLGVRLCAKKCLNVDLKSMKTKFYASFNGLFHRVAKMKDNLTVLHLVSTYCKPYLLYGTECFTLTVTKSRSLCHTWLTAVSHIFNVSGTDVNFVNSVTCNETLDAALSVRRIRSLRQLILHSNNFVLKYLWHTFFRNQLLLLNVNV